MIFHKDGFHGFHFFMLYFLFNQITVEVHLLLLRGNDSYQDHNDFHIAKTSGHFFDLELTAESSPFSLHQANHILNR